MKKNIYIAMLLIFTLSSLMYAVYYFYSNSIYNLVIPTDSKLWEQSFNKKIYKLNEEDRKYLKHYLDRHNPNLEYNLKIEPIPINLTIKRAILIEQEYLNSKEFQKDKAKQDLIDAYIIKKNELADNIFVTYLTKNPPTEQGIEISYAIRNKGSQDIIGFTGKLVFVNEQGVILDTINIDKKMIFPASDTTTMNETYNETQLSNFKFIREIPSNQLNCKIIINSVTFQNGNKLILPPDPR